MYSKDVKIEYKDAKYAGEVCLIEEFFKNEMKKPPHLRAKSCLISCPCSRHRVII